MDELLKQAETAVETLLRLRPEYSVATSQPDYRGGTNRIIFGARGSQPIVFKYFWSAERWRNESFCLRHFAATGVVPEILDVVPERLIVMTRLPGTDLAAPTDKVKKNKLGRQIGQALGKLAQTPLPSPDERHWPVSHFLWGPDLREILSQYLAFGRRIQREIPAYQAPIFDHSLTLLETQVDSIAHQRPMLFHEDIANTRVDQDEFSGFYDLELCRWGTESLQIGAAVGLCSPEQQDWASIVEGYETETRRCLDAADFTSILAMSHFIDWIRICRWGQWNGDPAETWHRQEAEADAAFYQARMQAACVTLNQSLPVSYRE